ncbi:hypothetical protein [Kitasatospora herbaricolor]|uniref:Transglycosylase SLT domain-containing protein n=1 Tax=Kitasatospora herbaricolor TaxID=68217 RepID=A0ABZ1WK02_9ACTN|nr:hypothetical protein [Kitasatospora herbaricolor]
MTAALVSASIMTGAGARADTKTPEPSASQADTSAVDPAKRGEILGKGWEKSADRAWSTSGDAEGFHILAADAKAGYDWHTVTTLREAGFDADQWIGNACVTGSGKRAVVVYAPRTFTNKTQLMARGGFTAVVDLASGQVTKLGVQTSLSYYNPGCGVGETAVLTQSPGEDKTATRLLRLDTESGTVSAPIEASGQLTSAVPTKDGSIVAAEGAEIVKVAGDGTRAALARTDSVPYRITPDGDGGVVFLDSVNGSGGTALPRTADASPATAAVTTQAKRITAAQVGTADAGRTNPEVLAEGPLTGTGVTRSQGAVYVTGETKQTAAKLPGTVHLLPKASKDATVSTRGQSVLNKTAWADGKDSRVEASDDRARPVAIDMTVIGTGRETAFTVDPTADTAPLAAQGSSPSPALPQPQASAAPSAAVGTSPGSPTETAESDRSCSVPRNDPRNQAMQPKPRQVEWAADQLVKGTMTLSRPANWKNLGMPAYQPTTLFPATPLNGGGQIPVQVLLGIAAQESNLWQAARSAVPGETANPLIGNYYGLQIYDSTTANDWDIDWSKADCGYGVTQVTDHMRLAGREGDKGGAAWDYQKQRAVALDYTANLAAGMQIITDKWNQTRSAGLIVNNGNGAKIENWFFALWAYNSGFYPQADAGTNAGKWGVGWANNPANPEWDESRNPFLEDSLGNNHYADAAHPQNWPYPEKVIGFAGHPVEGLESPGTTVAGFRAAWWNGPGGTAAIAGTAAYNRAKAKPPISTFCTTDNQCDPTKISTGAANALGQGPCTLADLHCWWNKPVQWKTDCDYSCGNEFVRFNSTYPEEADGTAYPPNCSTSGLPAGAKIVDDVADDIPSVRPGCSRTWTNAGSFSMDFGPGESVKDQNGAPATGWPAKIDTHQLGAGFGGHLFFAHTRADDAKGQRLKVTGTWSFTDRIAGLTEVFAHIPSHAAQTAKARYEIETAYGTQYREVNQDGTSNRWVSLGTYRFAEAPKIRLSTIAADGTGDKDIAFDAVAVAATEADASIIPNITLPAENPNAPDIDYSAGGTPMDIGVGGLSSFAKSAPGAEPQCSAVADKKQTTLCVTVNPVSAPEAKALAAQASSSFVPWCETTPGKHINRFEGCFWETLQATLKVNGNPVGTSSWLARQEVKLWENQSSFNQTMAIQPIVMDPKLVSLSLNLVPSCVPTPECSTGQVYWNGATTWLPDDKHVATASFSNAWQKGSGSYSNLMLGWDLFFTSPIATPDNVLWSEINADVRCDQRPTGTSFNEGCVFSRYTPTFTVNTAKHPTASAMYWVLMKKLPSHPGSKTANSPLHRETDQGVKNRNRDKICPTSYSRDPLVPASTCDEYPFASTKESGGSALSSGDQCVQFTGPQKQDGTWELKADPRYPPPTWSEICGRGSITRTHNVEAGVDLGVFYGNQRVIENDPFYVETPGFDNCTNVACDVRL